MSTQSNQSVTSRQRHYHCPVCGKHGMLLVENSSSLFECEKCMFLYTIIYEGHMTLRRQSN